MTAMDVRGSVDLSAHGIESTGSVLWNPSTPLLYEHAVIRGEARIAEGGPMAVDTGVHTGRSPQDKFIVREPSSQDRIWWDGNKEFPEDGYDRLREKVTDFLARETSLYVIDSFAGADPAHRIAVRVITTHPYHALFAKTMFIDPTERELQTFTPQAVVLHAPGLDADPEEDGTRTGTFVVLHPGRTEILVGGTFYAGEIKKSIFTVMNDRLPLEGVLPMHCSANEGADGRSAVFFGLSGTGKTTLSADPERALIGDDEHGWGDNGVFNMEGGCYAKVIRLSAEAEPEIFKTTHTFGTILENVAIDERGRLDLDDDSKTENTRAAYKLEQIANAHPEKRTGHPSAVVMLTADAFGILPPLARLSRDQALYYFLSGFTAKLAGTEIGVTEPQPTFSTCFGAPFLPQPPSVYAEMLGSKLDEHGSAGVAREHRLDGRAVRRGLPDADRRDARPPGRGALGCSGRCRVPHRSGLRLRGAGRVSGGRSEASRPPLDVARPGGLRPEGGRARRDVPRELRKVHRRRLCARIRRAPLVTQPSRRLR